MARKTHLDVADVTLFSAGDYLGLFKTLDLNLDPTTENGRTVSQRYELTEVTKKKGTFSIQELITNTTRQTGLNITIFSVGGTSYLGTLRTGQLEITTESADGSGGADEWEYPYAGGTSYRVTGELQIASTANFATLMASAGVSGLNLAVSLAFGGLVFQAPMKLSAVGHSINVDNVIQTQNITLMGRGTPTSVSGGTGILARIATGTAVVAYSINTGANQYAGDALITKSTFGFGNGQILTANHEFAMQGAPTVS